MDQAANALGENHAEAFQSGNLFGMHLPPAPEALQEAEQLLRNAETLSPNSARVQRARGLLALLQGDQEVAERILRAALENSPEDPASRLFLGIALGPTEEGEQLVDSVVFPDNPSKQVIANIAAAEIKLRRGKREEARLAADRVASSEPLDPRVLNALAQIYRRLGQLDEAIRLLENAHVIAPENRTVVTNLGLYCLEEGIPARALTIFRRLVEEDPTSLEQFLPQINQAFMALNLSEDAVEFMKEITDLNPSSQTAYFQRGLAEKNAKDYLAAAASFLCAAEIDPSFQSPHSAAGKALALAGRNHDALREFRIALNLEPDDPFISKSLGRHLISLGNCDEGLGFVKAAVESRPENAYLRNHLGEALSQCGRAADAQVEFMRALEINPQLEEARINLDSGSVPAF